MKYNKKQLFEIIKTFLIKVCKDDNIKVENKSVVFI